MGGFGLKVGRALADARGMSTIPERLPDVIDWCVDHVQAWAGDPAAIGLDEPTVDALDDLAQEAQAAERAYERAKAAAAAAGARYRERTLALRGQASSAVGRVRAFAATRPSPEKVLADARLPAPRDAGPAPAPGRPTGLTFDLLEDGALAVSFKCDNRPPGRRRVRGVTYVVERRDGGVAGEGPFVYVQTALTRRFVDATIPPGTASVTYRITAQTSTRRGKPAVKVVSFGAGQGGGAGGGRAREARGGGRAA